MADIHVLAGGSDCKSWRIAMHFAVPDQENTVSVGYRQALIVSGIGGTTVLPEGTGPGRITGAEKAQIEAGERYEHIATVPKLESGGTEPAQLLASARLFYQRQKADILNQLAARLRYFGFIADGE